MQWTQEANDKLVEYLSRDGYEIPDGLGTKDSACSVAAINLALTGELTYEIPDCMSYPLGQWIIRVQDVMPGEMRNSAEWKALLPLAAGTGREREDERLEIILDWMWGTVLPYAQPVADEYGFGEEWRRMCEERTGESARVAYRAADDAAVRAAAVRVAYYAYYATDYAARAARAAGAADAVRASDYAATRAAVVAADYAARAARATAAKAAARAAPLNEVDAWRHFDPVGLPGTTGKVWQYHRRNCRETRKRKSADSYRKGEGDSISYT